MRATGKLFDMFCVSEAKRAMEKPNVEGTSEHLILFYPFVRGVEGVGGSGRDGKGNGWLRR